MKNCNENEISVIVCFYNAEKFIKKTLHSILKQKKILYELILVNDGSTDKSVSIVKDLFPEVRIFHHEDGKNHGYSSSMSLGLSCSSCKYVNFIDADDVWLDEFYLYKQYAALIENRCVFSFCGSFAIDGNDNIMWVWNGDKYFKDFNKRIILQDCFVAPGGIMFDKEALLAVGGFDTSIQPVDHDAWIKLSEVGEFCCVPEMMLGYRQHGGQISRRRRQWEDGFKILENVKSRGYYTNVEINKRKAVLHYRLSQFDFVGCRYFSMLYNIISAFFYDPKRSINFLFKSISNF